MGKINFGKVLGIGASIALGAYLTREYLRRHRAYMGSYSPLINEVSVITDGVLSERWLFQWNDEERCELATQQVLNKEGSITSETILAFTYSEERVEIARYLQECTTPEEIVSIHLNSIDVFTTIVRRHKGGKEERWDAIINGAELSRLTGTDSEVLLQWREGNLMSVSYNSDVQKKMTYYRDKENYLFPDINHFVEGFSEDMLCTYLMGTRSKHFLRTMVTTGSNFHQQAHISYLLDSFDRPIQMLVEETEINNEITTSKSREFDIKYKKI